MEAMPLVDYVVTVFLGWSHWLLVLTGGALASMDLCELAVAAAYPKHWSLYLTDGTSVTRLHLLREGRQVALAIRTSKCLVSGLDAASWVGRTFCSDAELKSLGRS
jgi:hypothetical protein